MESQKKFQAKFLNKSQKEEHPKELFEESQKEILMESENNFWRKSKRNLWGNPDGILGRISEFMYKFQKKKLPTITFAEYSGGTLGEEISEGVLRGSL